MEIGNFDIDSGLIFENKVAPWDPPITRIFNLPVEGNLNGFIFFDRIFILIGLPVK